MIRIQRLWGALQEHNLPVDHGLYHRHAVLDYRVWRRVHLHWVPESQWVAVLHWNWLVGSPCWLFDQVGPDQGGSRTSWEVSSVSFSLQSLFFSFFSFSFSSFFLFLSSFFFFFSFFFCFIFSTCFLLFSAPSISTAQPQASAATSTGKSSLAKDRWKGAISNVQKQNSVLSLFAQIKHKRETHNKLKETFLKVRTQASIVSYLRRNRSKGSPSKIREPFSLPFVNLRSCLFILRHPPLSRVDAARANCGGKEDAVSMLEGGRFTPRNIYVLFYFSD